jgi:hypothetical protein
LQNFYGIDEQTFEDGDYNVKIEPIILNEKLDWMFRTCMPWEFAGLCLNIVKAYIDFEIGARKALSK